MKTSRHARPQVQRDPVDEGRPRLLGDRDDLVDLLGRVVDPRHQRGDQDARGDAGLVQLRHRLEPLARMRGVRLGLAPGLLVQRRHREVDADLGDLGEPLEVLQVPQRAATTSSAPTPASRPRAAPPASAASACIGPRPTGRGRCWSRRRRARASSDGLRSSAAQQLRHVDLDDDLALEVAAGVEVEVGVGVASEAVVAHYAISDEVSCAGGDVVQAAASRSARSSRLSA